MSQVNESSSKWAWIPPCPPQGVCEQLQLLREELFLFHVLPNSWKIEPFWNGPGKKNAHYQLGKGHPGPVNGTVTLQKSLGFKRIKKKEFSVDLRAGRMCSAMAIIGCEQAGFASWPVWVWTQGAQAGITLEQLLVVLSRVNKPSGRCSCFTELF